MSSRSISPTDETPAASDSTLPAEEQARRSDKREPRFIWLLAVALATPAVAAAAWFSWQQIWQVADVARARRAMNVRDFVGAAEILGNLNSRTSPTAEALFLQGRALRRQGRFVPADVCFTMALEMGWSRADVQCQRLLAKAQRGDVKEVEPELLSLIGSQPEDEIAEECYEAMAQGYVSCMRPARAVECVSFWKDWQPDNPQPWYWEGVVHEGNEAWQDALVSYSRAVAADGDHYLARLGRARMELETARVEEAESHFRECLERRPDDPEAAIGLAKCLVNQGTRDEAKRMLRDALALDLAPYQTATVLSELGQLQLEDEEFKAAAWVLAKAVEFDPISPRVRLILASALSRLGDETHAEEQRTAGHRLSEQQGQMTNIARRVRVNPENPDVRAEAGEMFLELGLARDAGRWFETAIQIDPWHGRSRRALAAIASSQGDDEAARRHRSFIRDDSGNTAAGAPERAAAESRP